MKAVLSGKQPKDYDEEADARSLCITPESHDKRSLTTVNKKLINQDSSLGVRVLTSRTNCKSTPSLRKRGRPPKAGPSKKFKHMKNAAELYKGKLSNLVRSPGMGCSDDNLSDGDWLY